MEQKAVSLEDAMNLATVHMRHDNYRVAEMVLGDVLAAYPDHGPALYMLGLARYFMSDLEGGLAHIKSALDTEGAEAEWWSNYGIILTQLQRYEEAVPAFEKAITIDPSYTESYWNKSHTHWLAGQYQDAEDAARQCLAVNENIPEAWLNLGTALVRLDRREEAMKSWEKALEVKPDFSLALNNLGNALREEGHLEASLEKCRKAVDLQPNYPEALNNLANVLLDLGELEDSEGYYRKAIMARPDYAEAHNNLAINLIKQSRFQEAMQEARVALSYRKDYIEAMLSLSMACRAVGELDEAEKAVQQAVILRPESAEARIDLADLLFMKDSYGDAEIELERARKLEPDSPRLYLKLSSVLERGNKIEEALEAVDKAVILNPEMPEAYWRKGNIFHIANRIPEAEESFRKALEIKKDEAGVHLALSELYLTMGEMDKAREEVEVAQKIMPSSPGLFLTLTKIKKFTQDDKDFHNMMEMEKKTDQLGVDQAGVLHFALYKAHEQIGDYDKAFEYLVKANAYKRETVPYDAAQQRQNFKMIQQIYSKESLSLYEGKGFESEIPVFILGMPRSGTTLTEQIISSHKDVYGAGELMEISIMEFEHGVLTPENAATQGEWYVNAVRKRDESAKALRITDKMPGNFANLGKISLVLPQARIIHTRRNPVDTCLSCFKQDFARGQYWSYNLEELGRYYNDYLDLMAYWREVLPEQFIDIDYEETVGDLEPQARKLIDYVGLPWDDACLEPHKQKRAVLTASKQQVTKPVYKTSVKSWQRYEKHLGPLIDALNEGPAKALLDL